MDTGPHPDTRNYPSDICDNELQLSPRVIKGLRYLAWCVIVLNIALVLFSLLFQPGRWQWDFECFYYAAQAWSAGLDPYELDSLAAVADKTILYRFLYPAITLYLFLPFSLLPYMSAYYAWLAGKILCLVGVVFIWRRSFLHRMDGLLVAVMALAAFNATIKWDLVTGNVSMVEQVLLWAGFGLYVAKRRSLFAACIVVGSLFKLSPIFFLLLLFFPVHNWKSGLRIFVPAVTAFCILAFGPFLFQPQLWSSFIESITQVREIGWHTPCALALFDHFTQVNPLFAASFMTRFPLLPEALWLVFVGIVLLLSIRPLRETVRCGGELPVLLAAVILYAVLVPRLKVYSYIPLIVPAILIVRVLPVKALLLAVLLLIFPFEGTQSIHPVQHTVVWSYGAWLQLMLLWLLWVLFPRLLCIAAENAKRVPDKSPDTL